MDYNSGHSSGVKKLLGLALKLFLSMTLEPAPGFFRIAFRDILNLLVIIGLGVGFLLSREGNASAQGNKIDTLASSFTQLSIDIKEMNKDGTRGSQQHIQSVEDKVNANVDRTTRIENAVFGPNGLNEKFTDVQSKLTLIANLLEGKKK